jgi:hypothetical protein
MQGNCGSDETKLMGAPSVPIIQYAVRCQPVEWVTMRQEHLVASRTGWAAFVPHKHII